MKNFLCYPPFARWAQAAAVLALLAGTASCAGHGSLQQKTRWYKHHSGGKSVPCPCGH